MESHKLQLEYYRKLAGMSVTDIAVLLGISRATVINYEKGNTFPSMESITRLAHCLSVTTDQLLGYSIVHK